jgi:hypothetical protein
LTRPVGIAISKSCPLGVVSDWSLERTTSGRNFRAEEEFIAYLFHPEAGFALDQDLGVCAATVIDRDDASILG